MRQEAVGEDEGQAGEGEDDRPLVQEAERQQQHGGAQGPGEDRVEIPGEGLCAPVPALVEDNIEVHHLGLRPQPPPPEIRVNDYCEGNPDQEASTANKDHILDADLVIL